MASARIVRKDASAPEKKPEKARLEAPLTLRVICPYCKEEFLLEDADTLKVFICPACGKKMRLKKPRPESGRQEG